MLIKKHLITGYSPNIWLVIDYYDIKIQIEHIQSNKNCEADLLSRMYSDKQVDMELLNHLNQNYIWNEVPLQYFSLDLQF